MADRDASFFGPVLETADDSVEAFSGEEIVRIRARRIAANLSRAQAAWPGTRRFKTLYPAAAPRHDPPPGPSGFVWVEETPDGVRIIPS
jgi:hypothetical protein